MQVARPVLHQPVTYMGLSCLIPLPTRKELSRTADRDPYRAVGCGICEKLEAAAVKRVWSRILYHDSRGNGAEYVGLVLDVFARGKEEYIRLGGGWRSGWSAW